MPELRQRLTIPAGSWVAWIKAFNGIFSPHLFIAGTAEVG